VYGVEDRIDFVCADAYDILNSLIPHCEPDGAPGVSKVDAVLLAPPWGGPEYSAFDHFDMSTGFPSGDGLELIKLAYKVSKNVVCVFPKNIMKAQVHSLMGELGAKCRVEEVFMYNKHKLSILYFGGLC
jgi:trimethylguanosine synthase